MNRLTDFLISSKARPVARRIQQTINFPIRANTIEKVLIILPRKLELLDRADSFIQSLRKAYPNWRVELFDIDKLSKTDLNRAKLPRQEIVNKLRNARYHFVLDLNDSAEPIAAYITLMTEARYRLHLQSGGSFYYNIAYHPQSFDQYIFYESLLNYLRKLFIKN